MRVVFDLDGTLIDSAPDIHAASNAALAEMGYPALSLDEVRSFVGKGVPNLVERLLQASGEDPTGPMNRRLTEALMARYHDAVALTLPYPGVRAALAALAAAGWRMGICTNKPIGPTRAVLAHLGLQDAFEVVLGGDSLPERKPDPTPLFKTFEGLGNGPLAYVGDSEVDAETAARAAVPFAIYTRGYRKTPVAELPHDAAFDDFADLPALIGQIAR
ncbi:MAG: phosphoglycolate phosphatase [Rhodobacteraceae bacterium]|nr:phosphoglycolate phosphatase [Paracoccaceae bacterium]